MTVMCTPASMMATGIGLGAVSSFGQAQAQKSALEYQSQVASINSKMAEQQAQAALQQGAIAEQNQELKTKAVFAAQRAAMAANGVDIGEGSPSDVLATTKYMGDVDKRTIEDNAANQAWGYRVQAANASANSKVMSASADAISPVMSATSSLLNGATQYAGTWYAAKKAGANLNSWG